MNKKMNRDFRWMQCLFCGRDLNLPVEVKRDSGESLFLVSGKCGCAICKVEIFFPDIEMIFRETDFNKVQVQKYESFFLMSCPDDCCTGKVKIYLDGAVEVRTSFATLREANENKHLGDKGNFQANISKYTSCCSECRKIWEVEIKNQMLFFETIRK